MIDHVSIAVRDLAVSGRFYDAVLAPLGQIRLITRAGTIGYGKGYPEFWLNERLGMAPADPQCGMHICLRAPDRQSVEAFHAAALQHGGTTDGAPGLRPQYHDRYFAAFVRDPDGNRIEAVTFLR